jgi:hypothetical protein
MDKRKVAKDKSTQTQEQQLAIQIINALKEWISIGSIENWINRGFVFEDKLKRIFCENAPKKYHPNHYLEFRLSICDKLWMDSIILKLKAKGKDGLAEEIEQRQNKFIAEVNAIDKNLEPTNLTHLPNLQLNSSAARLRNALKEALPYLGPQPASGDEKKKGIIWKILKIIVKVIGAIVIGIIVAIVIDILGDFGWLRLIKEFIYNGMLPK